MSSRTVGSSVLISVTTGASLLTDGHVWMGSSGIKRDIASARHSEAVYPVSVRIGKRSTCWRIPKSAYSTIVIFHNRHIRKKVFRQPSACCTILGPLPTCSTRHVGQSVCSCRRHHACAPCGIWLRKCRDVGNTTRGRCS